MLCSCFKLYKYPLHRLLVYVVLLLFFLFSWVFLLLLIIPQFKMDTVNSSEVLYSVLLNTRRMWLALIRKYMYLMFHSGIIRSAVICSVTEWTIYDVFKQKHTLNKTVYWWIDKNVEIRCQNLYFSLETEIQYMLNHCLCWYYRT